MALPPLRPPLASIVSERQQYLMDWTVAGGGQGEQAKTEEPATPSGSLIFLPDALSRALAGGSGGISFEIRRNTDSGILSRGVPTKTEEAGGRFPGSGGISPRGCAPSYADVAIIRLRCCV